MTNPYAPPGASPAQPRATPEDSADLFLEVLLPPVLKAAVGALIGMGFVMLLFSFRLVVSVVPNRAGVILEIGHALAGVLCFVAAWGVRNGVTSLSVLGMLLAPLVGVASLFALLTGSIAGLLGGSLSLLGLIALLVGFDRVRRIGRARAAILAMRA